MVEKLRVYNEMRIIVFIITNKKRRRRAWGVTEVMRVALVVGGWGGELVSALVFDNRSSAVGAVGGGGGRCTCVIRWFCYQNVIGVGGGGRRGGEHRRHLRGLLSERNQSENGRAQGRERVARPWESTRVSG